MYSNWVDAYEEDKDTAVVLLDMSAAFDKSILIEKFMVWMGILLHGWKVICMEEANESLNSFFKICAIISFPLIK